MSSYSYLPEGNIKNQKRRTDISFDLIKLVLEAMVPDHMHDLDEKRPQIKSGGVVRRSEAIINGNGTERSPIRSVSVLVITSMITDWIVLLPINHNHYNSPKSKRSN